MSEEIWSEVFAILLLALMYLLGHAHGHKKGIASRNNRSFDDGWNSRGIHDWQQSMAKRDAKGRFAGKPKL